MSGRDAPARAPAATNPRDRAAELTELWSPKVLAQVNDQYVKVAKVRGEFPWHAHAAEDELFLILRGRLVLQFRDGEVPMTEGDAYVVPRGVEHRPVAEEECCVMLVETVSTQHTGDVVTPLTRSIADQLG